MNNQRIVLKELSGMTIPQIDRLDWVLGENPSRNKSIVHKKITRLNTSEWGGNILKIDLTVKDESIYTQEEFSIIAKLIPRQNARRDSLLGFNKEVAFYEKVVPTLRKFQRLSGIGKFIDCFPDFLGARVHNCGIDADYGICFMKDLSPDGYQNVSRYTGFDLPTSKIVLKSLSKFHGIPLALKLTEPDTFAEELEPHLAVNDEEPINETDVGVILNILKESTELAPQIPRLKELLGMGYCKMRTVFCTLSHEELWIKNIMVRYSRGNPTRTKFLDFRKYTHDTLVKDLIFFFITSVQLQTLKENVDDLLQYYHRHLVETLKDFEIDDLKRFSYDLLLKEISTNTGFTFMTALSVLINQVVEDSGAEYYDASHVDGSSVCRKKIPLKIKEKVWWVVEEFLKRDWITF